MLPVVPALHHRGASQIFTGQGKGPVVTPVALNVQVAKPQTLVAKTQLLDDPQARGVFRSDVYLDPMQPQSDKRVVAGGGERQRHDPLSCNRFGDPVARGCASQRAPRDPEQMHLADESALRLNDKGLEPALDGLTVGLPNELTEGQPRGDPLGRRGLPPPQPLEVLGPKSLPLAAVLAPQGAQDH